MDFIDRMRQEEEERRQQVLRWASVPPMSQEDIKRWRQKVLEKSERGEPLEKWELETLWEIKREREEEESARKAAIGEQYLRESGCVAYAEKLKGFLNSQDSTVKARWSIDSRYMREDEGNCLEFCWEPNGIQHDFKVMAKVDGSLVFTGRGPGGAFDRERKTTTRTVTLAEWRTNKEAIDSAFELVYRNPTIWGEKFRNTFRG